MTREIHNANARQRNEPLSLVLMPSPRGEAKALLALLARGETVQSLRQLIGVTAAQRRELESRFGAITVIRAIAYREAVLDEFNKLVDQRA